MARVPGVRDALPDFDTRLKASFLANDLQILGYDVAVVVALPHRPDAPNPTTLAEAFGCLYVLEGATLGGQVIHLHLAAMLGVTPAAGCRFSSSYSDRVGAMRKAFGAASTADGTTAVLRGRRGPGSGGNVSIVWRVAGGRKKSPGRIRTPA